MYRPKISLPVLAAVDDGGPVIAYPAFAADLGTTLAANSGKFEKDADFYARRYRRIVGLANPFRNLSHFFQYLERLVYLRFPAVLTLFLLPDFLPRRFGDSTSLFIRFMVSPIHSMETCLPRMALNMFSAAVTGNVIIIVISPFDDFDGCFDFLGFYQLVNAEYVLLVHA